METRMLIIKKNNLLITYEYQKIFSLNHNNVFGIHLLNMWYCRFIFQKCIASIIENVYFFFSFIEYRQERVKQVKDKSTKQKYTTVASDI